MRFFLTRYNWRCVIEKYINSADEYLDVFDSLGEIEKYEYEKKINIKNDIGSGNVRIFDIIPFKIVYLNLTLNQDFKIHYQIDISNKFSYGITCPLEGYIIAEKNQSILNLAKKDSLLISIPDSLERNTSSMMCIEKNRKYKAISIYFEVSCLDNSYTKGFNKYWVDIIKNITDNKKQKYCSVKVNADIKSLFLNLLPNGEIGVCDAIAIKSKIYDILLQLKNLNNNKLLISDSEKLQLDNLKLYLEKNAINSKEKITLIDLSKKFLLNRDKMQKQFKLIYGETIFSFYRRIRLEKAFIMLKDDSLIIFDIAKLVGYKNERTFRKAFKNQYGMLPSEVKKHR